MELTDFIKETMQKAAAALREAAAGGIRVEVKEDESIVTQADLASEKAILQAIGREFPDDIVFSEESGLSSRERSEGQRIWIIDPLDGTTNFANGYPFYSISIGVGQFAAEGHIDMLAGGVMDVPRERVYLASRGGGATVNGAPLQVRRRRPFADCFLVTGFYYHQGDQLQDDIGRFARVAQACQSLRRDGSAALDLALVAEGIYDAFWERGLQPWDVAAGSLLVTEAGGSVGNYDNFGAVPFNIEGVGLIAGELTTATHLSSLLKD